MPAAETGSDPIPIACALPAPGLAQRSAELKAGLFGIAEEIRELAEGMAYRFSGTAAMAGALFAFITDERACCPFLSFELSFAPDRGPIWLRITGPAEVKAFIRETFATAG